MKRCSSCGYIVPGAWIDCRQCGAPLTLAQTAVAPRPPPAPLDDAWLPGAPRHLPPRDTGPDTMLPLIEPRIIVAETPTSRLNGRNIAIAALIVAFVIGAGFSLMPRGHHASAEPTILAPQAPFSGIPTNLAAVVRIEAESSRHTALSVVISAANPTGKALTLAQVAGLQPGYQWIGGDQPSTTNTMISIASQPGSDLIAVSGTNRTICAFARWSPAAGASYVTMDNVKTCAASAAPADGWNTEPGGFAQDLPDETGG